MADKDYIPFNETVFRGDGKSVYFRNWNIAGTPIDITDWVIFHTAKERESDADGEAMIARDSVNDTTTVVKYDNNSNGFPDSFYVRYRAEDTGPMAPKEYHQDIQIIEAAGQDPRTRAHGILTIKGDVTERVTT